MVLAAILDFEGQDYPILGNHLELYGKVLKHNKYHSIRFAISELAGKDTSLVSTTHLIQDIPKYQYHCLCFSMWRRRLFLGQAAILDLNVKKMVSEHSRNHSITCVMTELTGNNTSCAFLSSLYQEMTFFFNFQFGVGSHFGPPS